MTLSINAIKTSLNLLGGAAQPCHYQVIIMPPFSLLQGNSISSLIGGALSLTGASNVSVLAESASLPGKQLTTTPFRMYGTVMKMPYGAVYDDLKISFICTNSMTERLFFDSWMSLVMNPNRQYMNYHKNYVGNIAIIKLSPDTLSLANAMSIASANFIFLNVYPVSIQEQELSYDANDQYLKLTVNFAYRRYTTLAEQLFYSSSGAKPASVSDAQKLLDLRDSQGFSLDEISRMRQNLTEDFSNIISNWQATNVENPIRRP